MKNFTFWLDEYLNAKNHYNAVRYLGDSKLIKEAEEELEISETWLNYNMYTAFTEDNIGYDDFVEDK